MKLGKNTTPKTPHLQNEPENKTKKESPLSQSTIHDYAMFHECNPLQIPLPHLSQLFGHLHFKKGPTVETSTFTFRKEYGQTQLVIPAETFSQKTWITITHVQSGKQLPKIEFIPGTPLRIPLGLLTDDSTLQISFFTKGRPCRSTAQINYRPHIHHPPQIDPTHLSFSPPNDKGEVILTLDPKSCDQDAEVIARVKNSLFRGSFTTSTSTSIELGVVEEGQIIEITFDVPDRQTSTVRNFMYSANPEHVGGQMPMPILPL